MAIPTILSGAAGRALRTIEPIRWTIPGSELATSTINGAKSDLVKALGATRQPAFSAELHAASVNMRNGVNMSGSLDTLIGAVDELTAAARSTATLRVVGGLAVAGGIAGLVALARAGGEDGVPSAPGRPDDGPTHVSV